MSADEVKTMRQAIMLGLDARAHFADAPIPVECAQHHQRIRFFVPGVPVGKGRPRVSRIGGHARMYTPAKTAEYERLVADVARRALAGSPMLEGAVSLAMAIDAPVPASWSQRKQRAALAGELLPTTKPDADNVVKAVCDGLNDVLWRDDVQVVDLRVRKRYAATPGVRVEVVALGV